MSTPVIFKSEKFWVTIISVVGSITVAFIASNQISCNSQKTNKVEIENLKEKAGRINTLVNNEDYNELYSMFTPGLKPILTKEIFDAANDTMLNLSGNNMFPIDTTLTEISGVKTYFVRNQRQRGKTITSIAFDDKGNIFALYMFPVKR